MTSLWTLGPLQVTPYSLMILLGALVGAGLTLWRRRQALGALPWVILGALLLGHVFWCLFNADTYAEGAEALLLYLQPWKGGYTLYGALFGGLLGALLGAKACGLSFPDTLDALAPGAAAAICIGRLGEYFSGQGFGDVVELEKAQFFPLAYVTLQEEDYVEWSYAVWFWEAMAALILLILLLRLGRKVRRGAAAALFLTGLGVSQILLEQMRCDDYVRITTFIHFSQIAALVTLVALFALLVRKHRPGWLRGTVSCVTLTTAFLAVMCAEFVFDKPQINPWMYLSTFAAAAAFAVLLHLQRGKGGLLPGLMGGFIAVILFLLHALGEWEDGNLLVYCFMAFALLIVAETIYLNAGTEKECL